MSVPESPSNPRRCFLKALGGMTAGLAAFPTFASAQTGGKAPSRSAGAKYMGGFVAPKLENVKVAIIGVGSRGSSHIARLDTIARRAML